MNKNERKHFTANREITHYVREAKPTKHYLNKEKHVWGCFDRVTNGFTKKKTKMKNTLTD